MYKLLLASSVLAVSASIAAAEITLSGDARMGFKDDFELDPGADDDIFFTSRARVRFTFSGETDGGLSFGATFRADNASSASSGTAGEVFLSGAFGRISMGDVDGAALAAVGHVDGVGLTGLDDLNESAFLANGGLSTEDLNDFDIQDGDSITGDPSVLYEYNTGNIGLFVSVTNPGHNGFIDPLGSGTPVEADGIAWAIGANYSTDAYSFGIGYEDLDVDEIGGPGNISGDHLYLGADATFGGFTAKVRWGQADIDLTDGVDTAAVDFDQWSLSGTYAVDAISVTGFYSNKEFGGAVIDGSTLVADREAIGLGASYDLGGGASVVGGVVDLEETYGDGSSASDTAFDLGVSFSF